MFSYRDRFLSGLIGLAALAFLALTPAPASAGESLVVPGLFGGTHSSDGNVVIVVRETGADVQATFLAEDIHLSSPCDGQLMDLFIPDIAVNVPDESFNKTVASGGAGGQFLEEEDNVLAPPYIAGTAFVHLPGPEFECINSIEYEVDLEVLQLGDVNCSWKSGFQAPGFAASGDPPVPDSDGVEVVDALNILRHNVGLGVDLPPECPALETETPSVIIVGDNDCDGDIDAVDALRILRVEVGLPVTPPSPPCPPRMGIFYDPG
jgi:hypothetical protein